MRILLSFTSSFFCVKFHILTRRLRAGEADVAQSVERTTLNRVVVGSIPTFGAVCFFAKQNSHKTKTLPQQIQSCPFRQQQHPFATTKPNENYINAIQSVASSLQLP